MTFPRGGTDQITGWQLSAMAFATAQAVVVQKQSYHGMEGVDIVSGRQGK